MITLSIMSINLFTIMVIFAPMQYLRTGSCMVKISGDDFTFIGREGVPAMNILIFSVRLLHFTFYFRCLLICIGLLKDPVGAYKA